jgi:hypothetical protein
MIGSSVYLLAFPDLKSMDVFGFYENLLAFSNLKSMDA